MRDARTAPTAGSSPSVRTLLLVRNDVEHDARVLRAARVAERVLGGRALVVGVATAAAPAGATIVEGVPVLRLPARAWRLTGLRRLRASFATLGRPRAAPCPRQPGRGKRSTVPGRPAARPLGPAGRARRILSGLSFARQALSVARQTRPQLVHANDWNTMWTGLAIKLGYGARLVYDSHELWPDRNGRWEWRPWLLAGEALFVRAADELVTSSSGYADVLAARYRIPRPTVVRNIPECERRRPAVQPLRDTLPPGPPSQPRVVYVGGLMPGRGLEEMIDALALLPGVRLCAIGPGTPPYRASLLARASAAGVWERVKLSAPVAPARVRGVASGATAGLCLIQPVCRSYELCLPNKLFEYVAAGVPVLASDVPGIASVVREHGLGEVVPTSDPGAIAAGLQRLLAADDWRSTAARVRAFAQAHDWPGEAGTLEGVYRRAGRTMAA
jgi:glycosyltransferase involved in cell wall biosynthesis